MKYFFPILISLLVYSKTINAFDHSHSVFNGLLKLYVSDGKVKYKAFKDNANFENYLKSLSSVKMKEYSGFSKKEKLAFLINAYNAFTIKLVADKYPVKSIRDITNRPWAWTPWKIKFFQLLEDKRHLDWIEHNMLRTKFDEPRIHFAIVCASVGCPDLASFAYSVESLEKQLEKAQEKFLLSYPSKNRYDKKKKVLYLSPIFKWFHHDFTRKGSLIEYVDEVMKLNIPPSTEIKYTNYSWKLNE
ncbi:MAG: DUF547 domain-containing protein [Leptospiraceae bacterium]|nr:DUF547 domain-containing protein [Leptospiraceae bacterium]MCP5500236.1 DUF547 domain-containing protein [Leptospiraceae bacterium]